MKFFQNFIQRLHNEIPLIHQFVRNGKFLAIDLVISEKQYIDVDRTVRIYPLPFLIILRFTCPTESPLDILAYFQDHQTFSLGIISLRELKFIHHRSVNELTLALKSPRLRLQKRRNALIRRSKLHVKKTYRILYILSSITLIRA